ncbi:hypothetical protein BS78_02G370800 [Paspalum vaginatum]|nr:hypothetical protein BS78_02G370800 [Paspalum vaginatum]
MKGRKKILIVYNSCNGNGVIWTTSNSLRDLQAKSRFIARCNGNGVIWTTSNFLRDVQGKYRFEFP